MAEGRAYQVILELWWKAFLAAIVITVISKLFGFTWGIARIFFVGFLGCIVGIILLIFISNLITELWRARSKKK